MVKMWAQWVNCKLSSSLHLLYIYLGINLCILPGNNSFTILMNDFDLLTGKLSFWLIILVLAVYQQTQQATGQQQVAPPQLWGSDRIVYDVNDPMYKRWGLRAAPPYHKPPYKPPPPEYQITPCWLYVETMKDEKLMLAPQVNMPPPPTMHNTVLLWGFSSSWWLIAGHIFFV